MGFFGESNSEAVPPFYEVGRPAPRPSTGPSGGSPRGDPPCKMWRGSNGTAPFGPITSQYGGYFVLSNFYFIFYRALPHLWDSQRAALRPCQNLELTTNKNSQNGVGPNSYDITRLIAKIERGQSLLTSFLGKLVRTNGS